MSPVSTRRRLLGVNLFGLLLLLIVGASGQGALHWIEALDTDGQSLRQALQHQQQARLALDGLRTGIEQALQPQANAEKEVLTQDEASLFLDAHATALGTALAALDALPLNEHSHAALQALKPTLKGRLADIQAVALIGLKTGSTDHMPAIRHALDRLTHELSQFEALLLLELQAAQQRAASVRRQAQVALAALLGGCALAWLALGRARRRLLPEPAQPAEQEQATAPEPQPPVAPSAVATDPPPRAAHERGEDPQQRETLSMLRQLSQNTDQLTRLVSQIKAPSPAASTAPAQPAAVARPPSAVPAARGTPVPHPMADLAGAIEDIAFQSSMLVMNAEAAGNSESGPGYAQLVDEVRLLASRAAQTAKTFKSRIQPQPAAEPVIEPVAGPALEPDDDYDEGGVVVQIRQPIEAPAPAPTPVPGVALRRKDKVVTLEPLLPTRQDEAPAEEPQPAKAKPSATVLQTGRLLRTQG